MRRKNKQNEKEKKLKMSIFDLSSPKIDPTSKQLLKIYIY